MSTEQVATQQPRISTQAPKSFHELSMEEIKYQVQEQNQKLSRKDISQIFSPISKLGLDPQTDQVLFNEFFNAKSQQRFSTCDDCDSENKPPAHAELQVEGLVRALDKVASNALSSDLNPGVKDEFCALLKQAQALLKSNKEFTQDANKKLKDRISIGIN